MALFVGNDDPVEAGTQRPLAPAAGFESSLSPSAGASLPAPVAGNATTEADILPFAVQLELASDRLEYHDHAKKAMTLFAEVLQDNYALRRAYSYLASDTAFRVNVTPHGPKRLIIPGVR